MADPQQTSKIASTLYYDLRRQILKGDLSPGERLPGERELATKYATNRNTLREAVRRLEQARLVTVRHGQGVTVADFRRTGTMELLPAFLEAASRPRGDRANPRRHPARALAGARVRHAPRCAPREQERHRAVARHHGALDPGLRARRPSGDRAWLPALAGRVDRRQPLASPFAGSPTPSWRRIATSSIAFRPCG